MSTLMSFLMLLLTPILAPLGFLFIIFASL